ncbi:hypothetical protein [Streptomyces sp. NPDC057582]|uniref:hypothetical protein n=1 Tax=unclassified Streptomyces TaxID=2593676 RepID=UPI0036A9FFDA
MGRIGGDAACFSGMTALTAAAGQLLEKRLSQVMGIQARQGSGLGAPADIDELQRKITGLEQENAELTAALEEARSDLGAALVANRT